MAIKPNSSFLSSVHSGRANTVFLFSILGMGVGPLNWENSRINRKFGKVEVYKKSEVPISKHS